MRYLIFGLMALLAGCGSSDDDSALATNAQLQQQVTSLQNQLAQVKASIPPNEATSIQALKAQLAQFQLIGHPAATQSNKVDSRVTMAMLREPTFAPNAATVAGQFGPCPNMGVEEGFSLNTGSTDPLTATSKTFHTCMGYHVEYNVADGSVKIPPRLFWDGPNCTGKMYEWEAAGAGYDTATLKDGAVFTNPIDGTEQMVTAGQTPQPIAFQSVWATVCQVDQETQNMYAVTPHNGQTGAASSPVGTFTTGSP